MNPSAITRSQSCHSQNVTSFLSASVVLWPSLSMESLGRNIPDFCKAPVSRHFHTASIFNIISQWNRWNRSVVDHHFHFCRLRTVKIRSPNHCPRHLHILQQQKSLFKPPSVCVCVCKQGSLAQCFYAQTSVCWLINKSMFANPLLKSMFCQFHSLPQAKGTLFYWRTWEAWS